MHKNGQKIVSLVPSWTETLIECGLNVVGRTRFCIHPKGQVKGIPVVGGTKNLNLEELLKLNPDVVILDKEENKKEMAEALWAHGIHTVVSQIESIKSATVFLQSLADQFSNEKLALLAQQYETVDNSSCSKEKFIQNAVLKTNAKIEFSNVSYLIWKNPYMQIGPNTFIADVLSKFGISLMTFRAGEKYPKVSEENLKSAYVYFSSEPYPFEREFDELTASGFKGALVDGEKISWYGVRNLKFLQSCQE